MDKETLKINHIYNMDCLDAMRKLEDDSVDLIVTSPPYANQRKDTYGGIPENEYPNWMLSISNEIKRILKPTGSFVLNIKEHSVDGVKSTYVLKTVLLLSEIFMWKDTFIWNKRNPFPTGGNRRLKDGFEYCYWFTKSFDYKFFPDNVLVKSESVYSESEKKRQNKNPRITKNGSKMDMHGRYWSELVRPSNVITLTTQNSPTIHPATFPQELSDFFIKLMTEKDDLVYDPFAGSGTTCVSAKSLGRKWIGTELIKEYVDYANERISQTNRYKSLFD